MNASDFLITQGAVVEGELVQGSEETTSIFRQTTDVEFALEAFWGQASVSPYSVVAAVDVGRDLVSL